MSDICGVCGKEAVLEWGSSGCAPVSYQVCVECKKRSAENIDVAAVWIHLHGEDVTKYNYSCSLVAWLDGCYVGWHEIYSYYELNKDEIVSSFSEDYDLVDLPIDQEDE